MKGEGRSTRPVSRRWPRRLALLAPLLAFVSWIAACPTPEPPPNLLWLGDADRTLWGRAGEGAVGAAMTADDQCRVVVGAPRTPSPDGSAPEVGVIFAVESPAELPHDTPLDPESSADGHQRHGTQPYASAGSATAFVGDLDGSGSAELALGLSGAPATNGQEVGGGVWIYVDFAAPDLGQRKPDGILTGDRGHLYLGYALAGGADVTGDDLDDLLIGAPERHSQGVYIDGDNGTGRVYLIAGREDLASDLTAAATPGDVTDTLEFVGEANGDGLGMAVEAMAEEANAAVVLGAPYSSRNGNFAGTAYLCPAAGWSELDGVVLVGGECAALVGEQGEYAGYAVADAGDLDGSGMADLLIGAPQRAADEQAAGTGVVYLLVDPLIDLELRTVTLNSEAHTTFVGALDGDALGFAVAGTGDLDQDGFADFLLGAPQGALRGEEVYKGVAYLFTGRSGGFEAEVPVGEATIQLCGERVLHGTGWTVSDLAGYSLGGGGGWDGDPNDRFIAVAAPHRDNDVHGTDEWSDAGAVYLLHDALEPYLEAPR